MVKIIGLVSAKGGAGKTTVAVNLGASLASKFNRKVVAVDLNITTSHLGLVLGLHAPPYTLNDALKGYSLRQVSYIHNSGLVFVPASISLNDIPDINVENLTNRMRQEFLDMDYVLLDAAPGLGREALLTIQASDELILIGTPHIPSIVDIVKTKDLIEGMGKKVRGIVLNRVKNKKYELSRTEIADVTGLPVLEEIPEDDNLLRSTNSRQPLVTSYPDSRASESFNSLAANLIGVNYKHNVNLFRKLFQIVRR